MHFHYHQKYKVSHTLKHYKTFHLYLNTCRNSLTQGKHEAAIAWLHLTLLLYRYISCDHHVHKQQISILSFCTKSCYIKCACASQIATLICSFPIPFLVQDNQTSTLICTAHAHPLPHMQDNKTSTTIIDSFPFLHVSHTLLPQDKTFFTPMLANNKPSAHMHERVLSIKKLPNHSLLHMPPHIN